MGELDGNGNAAVDIENIEEKFSKAFEGAYQ
jgi:hypothetical protein